MQDVGLDVVGPLDQVAQDAAVVGDAAVDAIGLVEGEGCRQPLGGRADPADALHDAGGIPRVAPEQDVLQPAVHHPRALGLPDHTAVDHRLDLEVALDAGYRINHDLCCHTSLSFTRYWYSWRPSEQNETAPRKMGWTRAAAIGKERA